MRLVSIRRLRLRHFLLLDILGLAVCDQILIEGRLHCLHSTIIIQRLGQDLSDVVMCGGLHDLLPANFNGGSGIQRGIDPSGTHARSP